MTHVRFVAVGIVWVTAVVGLTTSWGGGALTAAEKDVFVINTAATPVPVSGKVEVTSGKVEVVSGKVEVVNDAVHEPYLGFAGATVAAGDVIGEVTFDVPDGKRLILETLSIQVSVPATQRVRAFLDLVTGISPTLSVIPVQSPGSILGTEYYVANQPFKLRKDAQTGKPDEIHVRMLRDSPLGTADLLVTLHGYLVDIN